MTMTDTLILRPESIAALRANGLTDTEIAIALAYRIQQRAEGGTLASDAGVDRELLSRGLSQADIDRAREFLAEQRKREVMR